MAPIRYFRIDDTAHAAVGAGQMERIQVLFLRSGGPLLLQKHRTHFNTAEYLINSDQSVSILAQHEHHISDGVLCRTEASVGCAA